MQENERKGSFDKLVAGLDSQDRALMLSRINQTASPSVQFTATEETEPDSNITLRLKMEQESLFHRFFIWLRAMFKKCTQEQIYNQDILAAMARNVNRDHPGLLNHRIYVLEEQFYTQLKALKDAADFFKNYLSGIEDNTGSFYVFLSSFVSPELSDNINAHADPFMNDFSKDPSMELKNSLSASLDSVLNEIRGSTRKNLYNAVKSVNWLLCFSRLPFLHFISQFTNIMGGVYTCPYRDAVKDYENLAAVFDSVTQIPNEILEAIFLYGHKKEFNVKGQNVELERQVKEYLAQANSHFAVIQMFRITVPVKKIGKIINQNYDWQPQSISGAEDWFSSFKTQWKKILEIRWNKWVRERKKNQLGNSLKIDFSLETFPVLKYTPWKGLWIPVNFSYELTGGFLTWFSFEKYGEILPILNDVMMEGVFIKSENRTEYSENLSLFVQANTKFTNLTAKLSPEGEYGILLKEFASSSIKNNQMKTQVASIMSQINNEFKDIILQFTSGCRGMDGVFHGFFDDDKDGVHENLQNWTSLKGKGNRLWRESLFEIRKLLKNCVFYISEFESIDKSFKDA